MQAFARPAVETRSEQDRYCDRTAVILNKNAKKVTARVRKRLEEILPETSDLFFTESLEQARFVIRRVVDSGYSSIVTGGGDGTVVNVINEALNRRESKGYAHCPRFSVLRLGTGNAIADFLGAGELERDLSGLQKASVRWLDIMKINGQRTTFGGFGWDAHILNNYNNMRIKAEKFGPSRALFKTVGGYLVAGLGQSVPQFMLNRPSYNVKVVNGQGIGFRLGSDGAILERIAPGAVAFEGTISMGCFGTTPYYGYKMNIMPYADKSSGLFQLRLIDMKPLAAVRNLRKIWQGSCTHPGLIDFQLSSCRIEFDQAAPLQIAGDASGETQAIDIALDHPIRCTNFAS
ncbi:MAG: diacylglycerol kinase family protein [Myxococcota bacterium]|nr:diacylglycerol kinase family protein [Myxococcota bacterium]